MGRGPEFGTYYADPKRNPRGTGEGVKGGSVRSEHTRGKSKEARRPGQSSGSEVAPFAYGIGRLVITDSQHPLVTTKIKERWDGLLENIASQSDKGIGALPGNSHYLEYFSAAQLEGAVVRSKPRLANGTPPQRKKYFLAMQKYMGQAIGELKSAAQSTEVNKQAQAHNRSRQITRELFEADEEGGRPINTSVRNLHPDDVSSFGAEHVGLTPEEVEILDQYPFGDCRVHVPHIDLIPRGQYGQRYSLVGFETHKQFLEERTAIASELGSLGIRLASGDSHRFVLGVDICTVPDSGPIPLLRTTNRPDMVVFGSPGLVQTAV